jgi:transcriptional regulator with XRE-family HTH domain
VPRNAKRSPENPDTVAGRLEAKIREAHPGLTIQTAVQRVADATGLSKSQINRIRAGETRKPHSSTLSRLAEHLGTTAQLLRHGVDTQQTDAFAVAFPSREEAGNADPTLQVSSTVVSLRRYPRELQVRACRAAVAAMLDVVASAGQIMPEGYRSLAYLDGMQRTTTAQLMDQSEESSPSSASLPSA